MSRHDSVRIALLASAALLFATPAFAQDSAATGQTAEAAQAQDGEIIVTARRRAESLIDVPIAVTAISGAQLEAAGALDITDIAQSAPNVSLEVSRGTNNTLSAFIRGVGQQDPVAGFEAGVGLYLDDVYLNRPQAAVLDIYDVERIEVLRGPQGTLYGRNTIGGAVKYVTKRIGSDPQLQLRGTYGSYNQADLVVSGSAPIGDTGLKVSAAGARLSRGGFGTNLTTGQDNYNKDLWAARGTVEYEPSSSAFFRVSGDYTHDKSNSRGGHRLIPGIVSGTPVLVDKFDSQGGLVTPRQDVKAWGVTGLAELRPATWLTFRSITAYRKDDSATPIDFDALPAVQVDVPAFYNNKQFSQEAQLLVDTGGLSGLLGVYYLDAKARTVFDVRLPGGVTALTFGDVKTDTVAVFGDFTYDLTPMFSVSAAAATPGTSASRACCARPIWAAARPISAGPARCSPPLRTSAAAPISRSSPRAPRSASSRARTIRSTQAGRRASRAAASIRAARPAPAGPPAAPRARRHRSMTSCRSIPRR